MFIHGGKRERQTQHVINSEKISQSRTREGWPVSAQLSQLVLNWLARWQLVRSCPASTTHPCPNAILDSTNSRFSSPSLFLSLPSSPAPVDFSFFPSLILTSRPPSHLDSHSSFSYLFSCMQLFGICQSTFRYLLFPLTTSTRQPPTYRVATRSSSASVPFVYLDLFHHL